MINVELHGEHLAVLPLRLETITLSGDNVIQKAAIDQANFSNQIGGNCKLSSCNQFHLGINAAAIDQNAAQRTILEDFIHDNRQLFQVFGDHGGKH